MSIHPNVILLVTLTPDGLSRKTRRDILAGDSIDIEDSIEIGEYSYHHEVMESDYNDNYQISAAEGDIIIFDMVTYGYGRKIDWDDLAKQRLTLETWAINVCARYHCSYKIFVTANYW